MKPLKNEDAVRRLCPFTFHKPDGPDRCCTNGCMAWSVVHEAVKRENHSGAYDALLNIAVKTQRLVRREGPNNSTGFVILDEVGVCLRLEENAMSEDAFRRGQLSMLPD